jgi:DNA sulfur modification protein DndB
LALCKANDCLLKAFEGGMDVDWKFKQNRPSDEDLDAYYEYLARLWTVILEASPDLQPVIE